MILDSAHGGYLADTDIERCVVGANAEVQLVRVDRASEVADMLSNVDVVISWHQIALDRVTLELMGSCKGIVRASVGYDNIELDAAHELGIRVCIVPDYGTEEVADHTLMLLLAVTRNLASLIDSTRLGGWRWQAAESVPRLRGRRLGIVGLGRIGTAVAIRARSFGMEVSFFDPHRPSGVDKALGIKRAESLHELLCHSEILALHLPLNPDTQSLIGAEELDLLRPGAILVNTSRGAVVDQAALIAALGSGHIAGAGLDVLANEPSIPIELREHPRVLLTAHSAFYSDQALAELRMKAAAAALRLLQLPRNRHRDELVLAA